MKHYLCFLLLMGLSSLGMGQSDKGLLAIETDPVTTIFGAKTISVILERSGIDHWSLFVNVVSADFPNWMNDFLNPRNKGKGFDPKIKIGGGFAIDYFLKSEREGLYFGLLNLLFNNRINRGATSQEVLTHNVIPRAGYRWFPFKKKRVYLNPFMGLRYEYKFVEEVIVDDQTFEAAGWGPFGTLHIGYHF